MANHLLEGDVVFWTGRDWSRDPREAAVAQDLATAAAFETEARAAFLRHEVVDAGLIDVAFDPAGLPVPNHFRERFRTRGPSHRPDLGKQAEFSIVGETR